MSLAADQAPKSAPASSSAPPANMPAVLNREPSQQDLEIARQLQSFQSQAIPSHETPQTDANAQQTPKSMSDILSDSKPQPQPDDHHSRNSQQPSPSPYPPAAQFTPLQQPQPQQRTPQSSSVSGGGNGQICSNCGTTKTPLWRRSPTGAVICNACGLYYKARNQMRPVGLKRGAAASSYSDNNAQERGTSPKAIQGGATYVAADQTNDGTCPGGGRCNGTGGHDGCSGCPAYNNRISKTAQVALRQTSHDPNSQTQGEGSAQRQAGGAQQSVMIACQNCGTTITPLWRRDELGNTICNACGLYHKLHGHHRPVQMKKAEIKRRKRVVPNNMVNDDQSSVYTAETAEDERRSIPPHTDAPSPSFSNQPESKLRIRVAGGPIPVDFTDTFRAQKLTPSNNESSRPNNPRKRSFSAAAGQEGENAAPGPYAHAQNMVSPGTNNANIDPSLPARNREPSAEPSPQTGGNTTSSSDKDARRAALEAESEKMLLMLQENRRKLEALQNEE